MTGILKEKVAPGLFWVEVPEQDLRLMCGSPADAIKHLTVKGHIQVKMLDQFYSETGPNAILVSDLFDQKGQLANLTEFPLLHILYKQGLILPGHPNQSMGKPILVGDPEQLRRQKDYFFRGNSGLVKVEEYKRFKIPQEVAEEWISIKRRFAFGHFPQADEIFDCKDLRRSPIELRPGVVVTRLAVNVFEISYQGTRVEVDLNLGLDEQYGPSFELPKITLPEAEFAVVHIGEGDGWDPNRPCHSSLILHQGRRYLFDAGPNIQYVLSCLGLGPQDLEGVILTHVHDDHFSGLYALASEKRGLTILAAPSVYASMIYKFSSLVGISLEEASGWFHHEWLHPQAWNEYKGLDLFPHPSPHPIDTTLFMLRAQGPEGYKSYGHYADITALSWLKKMSVLDKAGDGITRECYENLKQVYALPFDVKKVDVGGLPIHGEAKDFIGDGSKRLILSHTSRPLTPEQLKIGEQAEFGEVDILIP